MAKIKLRNKETGEEIEVEDDGSYGLPELPKPPTPRRLKPDNSDSPKYSNLAFAPLAMAETLGNLSGGNRVINQSAPENAVDLGQMLGGATADLAPVPWYLKPILEAGGTYLGGKAGSAIQSYFSGDEPTPDSEQWKQALLSTLISTGFKTGVGAAQEGLAFRNAVKTGDFETNPSDIVRWLSDRYLAKQKTSQGPISIFPKHTGAIPTNTNAAGNITGPLDEISEGDVAKMFMERDYPALTSQLTNSPIASQQEAGYTGLGDIFQKQDAVIRDIAGDISKKGMTETPQTRGDRWEKLTVKNVADRETSLIKQQNAIIKSATKGTPKETFITKVPVGNELLDANKVINKPIYLDNSSDFAKKFGKTLKAFETSTIEGKLLSGQGKKDWELVKDFVETNTYKNLGGKAGSPIAVTEFEHLMQVRQALRNLSTQKSKFTPAIKELAANVDKDLSNFFDAQGSYGLGNRFNSLQKDLDDLADFKATRLGKTFGSETGKGGFSQRVKSKEEGFAALLEPDNSADFDRFLSLNGKEKTAEALKESMIAHAYENGGFNTGKVKQFIKDQSSKFQKVLTSEERHSINRFLVALEMHDRRNRISDVTTAMSRNESGNIVALIGTAPGIGGTGFSAVARRAAARFGYIELEQKVLSKLVTNPKFAYAAARLTEVPAGSKAARGPMKTIIGLMGKAGVTFNFQTEEGMMTPMKANEEGTTLTPIGGRPIKVDDLYNVR